MAAAPESRWIRFLRNYGPIPTNDNMYDETIQRALRRLKIDPLVLPAQFLDAIVANFRSERPQTEILTGTAATARRTTAAKSGWPWAAPRSTGTAARRFKR
jgi:hypothetical protein